MGRRLSKVERVMRQLPYARPASSENLSSAPLGSWQLPAPHRGSMVSFGGGDNPHTALTPLSDNRTTAQVIADMVSQSRHK
jgi:hypothetical protein